MSLTRSSRFDGVRIAARTLRKQPGFTAVVVLSLALAIALNTTIYSVFDAMISPRVDMRAAEDIFTIRLYGNYRGRVGATQIDSAIRTGVANIAASAWVDQVSSFFQRPIEAGTNYAEISVRPISLEYFPLIGPRLIAGRTFIEGDQYATTRPVVLAERTAATLFPDGKNPIGANVSISDTSYVVVGVLSRYSDFPNERAGAWVLGTPREKMAFMRLIRLKPGASAQDADRELTLVAQRIALAGGEAPRDVAFRFFRPAQPQFRAMRFHYAIGLSVLAVLLVACANLANMQLARGITRRRELALRTALGATRGRIVRHLLTESVLLASGGLLLGLVLTYWGMVALRAGIPPEVGAYSVEMQWSWRIFVFALVATVACIFIVGVAPAIRVSRVDPNEMLKSGAGTGASRQNRRQYGYLVAAEIALALGVLNGASLLVKSALATPDDNLSYDPTPLVSGYIQLSRPPKHEMHLRSEILQQAAARVAAIDGVAAASASMNGSPDRSTVTLSDSGRGVREIPATGFSYDIVSPGYLRAMGIPVVRGRDFLDGERDEAGVIIDDYTAAALWPGANPVGALIKFGDGKSNAPFVRIIGVAGRETARRGGLPSVTEARLREVYYLPGPRDSITVRSNLATFVMVVARASGNPSALPMRMIRAGVRGPHGMDEDRRRARAGREFTAQMFSLFAALGLGLAAFGVYGVVAHSVAERRRELGVRIALGASARDVLRDVLRENVVVALAGLALGLLATKYGVPLLTGYVFEDDIYNAPLFAAAATFLLATAAMSAFVPALRATRVDPTESLRCE